MSDWRQSSELKKSKTVVSNENGQPAMSIPISLKLRGGGTGVQNIMSHSTLLNNSNALALAAICTTTCTYNFEVETTSR